jgi:hypothetical protein
MILSNIWFRVACVLIRLYSHYIVMRTDKFKGGEMYGE